MEDVVAHLEANIQPISWSDSAYPALLRLIPDPPAILFVKGNLDAVRTLPGIAVIGTREPTLAGPVVAKRVTQFLVDAGFCIVSGLARGIDAVAHRTAIDSSGRTVAVMAEGLDKIYPKEHTRLAEEILEGGGALVSEHQLGVRARGASFVERDRIQSGLSLAVVPIQTSLSGGTMHTVRFAEKQSRPVFCPKPVHKEMQEIQYEGIRALIDSGRAWSFDASDYAEFRTKLDECSRRTPNAGKLFP
jgi:DNA processing protein